MTRSRGGEPGFVDELLEAGPVDFTKIEELGRGRTCESRLLE